MKVSIVIPTLNAAPALDECLKAIRLQDFPQDDIEIIIADAGSSDDTRAVANRYHVTRIIDNPLKTAEAGKAVGISISTGDVIALIDSDNILPDSSWLVQMTAPFEDSTIFATEPIRYSARTTDSSLTRYFAALGMNDPLCLFTGNYDRFCAITKRWTGCSLKTTRVQTSSRVTYTQILPDPSVNLPTIGANGFIFRKKILSSVHAAPYFFDIDVASEAYHAACGSIAKVETSIIHLYCSTLKDFVRKQNRRITDFLYFNKEKSRTYTWKPHILRGPALMSLSAITILPLLIQQLLLLIHSPKGSRLATLWHLPVVYSTLFIYARAVIKKALGLNVMPADRATWQQVGSKAN